MKILIEVPDNWLDSNKLDDLSFITRTCKQELQKVLLEKMTDEVWKTMKIPKITISEKELKKAILNRMVEERMQP